MSVEAGGRLTPEEDAALRRLHYFRSIGIALSPELEALEEELRARDHRREIRDPEPTAVVVPGPRAAYL